MGKPAIRELDGVLTDSRQTSSTCVCGTFLSRRAPRLQRRYGRRHVTTATKPRLSLGDYPLTSGYLAPMPHSILHTNFLTVSILFTNEPNDILGEGSISVIPWTSTRDFKYEILIA